MFFFPSRFLGIFGRTKEPPGRQWKHAYNVILTNILPFWGFSFYFVRIFLVSDRTHSYDCAYVYHFNPYNILLRLVIEWVIDINTNAYENVDG